MLNGVEINSFRQKLKKKRDFKSNNALEDVTLRAAIAIINFNSSLLQYVKL